VLFLPFYIKNRIYTVPEFLERRFGSSVRLAFSAFMVVLSVLAKISISLWAASLVFHEVFGWNQMAVIWGVGLVTALYTMKGGLSAVVFTDAIQTTVLILAAVIMTAIGLHQVGGYAALRMKLDPVMFSMVRPATDPDLPWPGVFIGVFLVGTFYFSMDQVLVQRVFAAKNLNEGRLGATFCAFLKTLNPIILVGPGLIAAALYPGLAKGDLAYPTLLKNLMPTGLLGLTVAGITAALMGHLSATYNSIATLVTRDFYLKLRPCADQDRQILIGRIAVLSVFILGAIWAPVIGRSKSMFIYLQTVSAYLMMPFAVIFLFAVFWKRTNTPSVLACMVAALILCPTMMLNNQEHFLPFMNHPLLRPWLHGAMLVTLICMLVLVAVSLLTAPPPAAKLENTTVASLWGRGAKAFDEDDMMAVKTPLFKDYRLWLTAVSVGTAIAWYIMR